MYDDPSAPLGKAYAPTFAIAAFVCAALAAGYWFGWDGVAVVVALAIVAFIWFETHNDERG